MLTMMTAGDVVRVNSRRVRNDVAIVWHDVRETYNELNLRTNSLANALISMGVSKGDRLALLATNCHQFVEVYIAGFKIGAIIIPLNTMLHPNEILNLVNHCEPSAVFITSNFVTMINSIRSSAPTVKEFVSIGGGEGMRDYETLISTYPPSDPSIKITGDYIATIAYTSGTTGSPKGVTITHSNIYHNWINCMACFAVSRGSVQVLPFPLFFSAVFLSEVLVIFFVGGRLVLLDRFRPEPFMDAINRERPTFTVLNPTMLNDLLLHPDVNKCNFDTLKHVTIAMNSVSETRFKEAQKIIGNTFCQAYGLTECTGLATSMQPQDYEVEEPARWRKRLSSIGRALPVSDIRVVNDKGKDVVCDGEEVGELIMRGANVTQGYWKQPELTGDLIKNGWLYTGDLATMDENGYLWIVGRKKDMIVSGGANIYPAEIEDVLYTMREINEVAVVGRPHEHWGESVTAIIVPKPDQQITERKVIDYCKDRLASYKKPTKVIFLRELPHNPSGKILKAKLRELLAKGEIG